MRTFVTCGVLVIATLALLAAAAPFLPQQLAPSALNPPLGFLVVVVTIGIFGLLGGTAGGYLSNPDPPTANQLRKSRILGVTAASLVPLLLNLGDSSVLKDILALNGDWPRHYFSLAGFCIVAATFSRHFIETVSSKVMDRLTETERKVTEAEQNAQKAVQVSVEANVATTGISEVTSQVAAVLPRLSAEARAIVEALQKSPFRFSTVEALASEAKLPTETVRSTIETLEAQRLLYSIEIGELRAYALVHHTAESVTPESKMTGD